MATTSYTDFTAGCRAIGARTDSAGVAATDLSSDEDRLINHILTEGYLTSGAFQVSADSPASMDVIVGSGTAKADVYVVEGDDDGQHPYIVRLDDVSVTVTVGAADASNPRIDEIWLVVADATFDSGSVSLPRIGYRKGTAAASPAAPGADASWKAAVKLATITVGASATSIGSGDIADNRTGSTSALPDLLGSAEVDGATTDASHPVTTSWSDGATVSLSIPSTWREWKVTVWATFGIAMSTGLTAKARLSVDGSAQQALEDIGAFADDSGLTVPGSLVAHVSGLTTTGSRDMKVQFATGSSTASALDISLYARAVRTA